MVENKKQSRGSSDWHCELPETSFLLQGLADRLVTDIRRAKTKEGKEVVVHTFLDGYFALGSREDITETLIRDTVWAFLVKKTRLSERVLDKIWTSHETASNRPCVVM